MSVQRSVVVELFALIGVAALVVTVLKGRAWVAAVLVAAAAGLVVLVALRGDVSAGDVSTTTLVLVTAGTPLWALVAVLVAARPATTDSQWTRRRTVDASGRPLLASQPVRRRLGRAVLGAILGALPAVTLMAVVLAVADTGDEAQIAFVGIPFGAFGIAVGALIGYQWLPRSALGDAGRRHVTAASAEPGRRSAGAAGPWGARPRPAGPPGRTADRDRSCASTDPGGTRPQSSRRVGRAARRGRRSPTGASPPRGGGRAPGERCRSRPGPGPGRPTRPPPRSPGG